LLWFHPRPFMVPVGNSFFAHVADSSFPSDHVTFMAAIALGLGVFAGHPRGAVVLGVLTVLVAWARVFLGVHFPFDMIGSAVMAALAVAAVAPFQSWTQRVLLPRLLLPVYRFLFAYPICLGWCRD